MMTKLIKLFAIGFIAASLVGCFGTTSYIGKVNVVGIGAGSQPIEPANSQYVNQDALPNVVVGYTPNLQIKEQAVSGTVKYLAGDALIKEYSGEPQFLVDYLNYAQTAGNKVYLLDKNGVVAWSGVFRSTNIKDANGVYDYGLTGAKKMTFDEAMEKFALDQKSADFDKDKQIKFPTNNKENFASGFSYESKYPVLRTKLPDMKLTTAKGETSLSQLTANNKPTVVVLFDAKGDDSRNLMKDAELAKNVFNAFQGKATQSSALPAPQSLFEEMEKIYFVK